MFDRAYDGRPIRMLIVIDEYTRECLAIETQRRLNSQDVLDALRDLFVERGTPAYIRSDNGAELTAIAVREWLERVAVQTLFIEPGSPWENGYNESFTGKLRDEGARGALETRVQSDSAAQLARLSSTGSRGRAARRIHGLLSRPDVSLAMR